MLVACSHGKLAQCAATECQPVLLLLLMLLILSGHELCREGDHGDCLWLLQDGEMLATRHMREVEFIRAPSLLGESILLADEVPSCAYRPCTFR